MLQITLFNVVWRHFTPQPVVGFAVRITSMWFVRTGSIIGRRFGQNVAEHTREPGPLFSDPARVEVVLGEVVVGDDQPSMPES